MTKNEKLNALFKQMEQQAGEYDNFDESGFDNFVQDNWETFQNLDEADTAHLSRRISAIRSRNNYRTMNISAQQSQRAIMRAQFDIVATRLTANIAGVALDYAIFGHNAFQSAYQRMVLAATGGTFTVTGGTHNALPNSVDFTHTVGANTDIVRVTCNQIPYPELLQGLSTGKFRISKLRYRISDVAQLTQFNNKYNKVLRTLFGTFEEKQIPLVSQEKPSDFKNNIIDVPAIIDMTRYDTIVNSINASANFAVTHSVFVEKFDQF